MQKYFREHRWQRNIRLALMCGLLVLLIIAIVPTASFNWHSEQNLIQVRGPSGSRFMGTDDFLVYFFALAKSAAQPVSPTLCYFDVSSVNKLYHSADPCRWGGFIPVRPPQLSASTAYKIKEILMPKMVNISSTTGDMLHVTGNESGLGNSSSSPSLDYISRPEETCDFNTPLSGTISFEAAVLGVSSLAVLSSWNAVRLFALPSALFRRRIRNPISRYSRRVIDKTSKRATRTFPTTSYRPDFAESVVTMPMLALHLTGRLILDIFTSELAKVGQYMRQTLLKDQEE